MNNTDPPPSVAPWQIAAGTPQPRTLYICDELPVATDDVFTACESWAANCIYIGAPMTANDPPLCPECGAEMYEDRGRYDWVCPTRYHAADIENYSGEPDPVDEDSPDGQ